MCLVKVAVLINTDLNLFFTIFEKLGPKILTRRDERVEMKIIIMTVHIIFNLLEHLG